MTAVSTRPSPSKGSRTRKRLLDAAAAEVARHGRAGASLSAIAAAAGLKPGSIYFHFGSRDQLIEAMLEEGLSESLRRLDAAIVAVPGSGHARARLRAAIRAHLDALHDLSDYAVVVLTPAFDSDDVPAAAFRALRRRYLRQWSSIIAGAQADGVIAAGVDPRAARDLLLGALNAAGLAGRPPAETAPAAEALLTLPEPPAAPS